MSALLANKPTSQSGLAPDPALPQRELLLDGKHMATALSSFITRNGPVVIDSFEKRRIKYRLGESLRVLYRLSANGQPHLIAAKAFAGPTAETAFWMFPEDRKLKHLSLLHDTPETLANVLRGRWRRSECVAYVPEKCTTVRCLDREGKTVAYAKMYAAAERSLGEIYRQLSSACTHAVKPLEYSQPYNLLLLEAVPGKRISDLKDKHLTEGFAGLARALASLHSAPVLRQLPRFQRHDLERLRQCAHIIGLGRPDVARLASKLFDDLRGSVPPAGPMVCLHGDVHPKNGIARDGIVTLIDLDQAAVGPAAAELGSMLALLHYNRRIGLITQKRERDLASAFLAGYAAYRELPVRSSLCWHTAAALLSERALRSVNRIRPEGLRHLSQLLADARAILRTRGGKS